MSTTKPETEQIHGYRSDLCDTEKRFTNILAENEFSHEETFSLRRLYATALIIKTF